jgi:hypothetical protein
MYGHIVAEAFFQRCSRRPVPESCVPDLQMLGCHPSRESDGSWSALDTARTRSVLAAYETTNDR